MLEGKVDRSQPHTIASQDFNLTQEDQFTVDPNLQ